MTEPMQESVAAQLPVMAPNTALAMTETAPRPPLICPMNISMKPTSASPSLPFSMIPPAMTNMGIARRTSEFSWLKPTEMVVAGEPPIRK